MVNDVRPPGRKKKKKIMPKNPSSSDPKFKANKVTVKEYEPTFVTPDSIHDKDPTPVKKSPGLKSHLVTKKTPKKPGKLKLTLTKAITPIVDKWNGLSKRARIITIVIALLFFGGAASAAVIFWPKAEQPKIVVVEPEPEPEPEPVPTTEPSNLTGIEVDIAINKRPVIGVMVENSPDARPQAGLDKAGVIFEAIAEGGITRFLTLFQDEQPEYLGPVRSARPYYISWLLGFDAAYGHAGGSGEAISQIRSKGVKDLDQFASPDSYDRVSSRYAPHNLYTGIARLVKLAESKGYNESKYTSFARKEESAAKTPTAKTIDISISSALYNVAYGYNAKSNSYLRSMAGTSHKDEKTGNQLNPKVVVALITDKGFHSNGVHTTYRTIGSGKAVVFQDGLAQNATWSKTSDNSQITFKDSKGKVLKLNAGQTWITVVGDGNAVTYSP
jgi:hypothetical protein